MTRGHLRVIEPAPKRPPVPSLDERAAYFRRTGQTVAEQVGRGPRSAGLIERVVVGLSSAAFLAVVVNDGRRKRWEREGTTVRSWLYLRVYGAVGLPANFFRRAELWAIGKAGDATNWGEP